MSLLEFQEMSFATPTREFKPIRSLSERAIDIVENRKLKAERNKPPQKRMKKDLAKLGDLVNSLLGEDL